MANYAYPNPITTHTQMSTFVCPKYTKAHLCMSQLQYYTYTMANYAYPNLNTTHAQMSTFVCPKYTKNIKKCAFNKQKKAYVWGKKKRN